MNRSDLRLLASLKIGDTAIVDNKPIVCVDSPYSDCDGLQCVYYNDCPANGHLAVCWRRTGCRQGYSVAFNRIDEVLGE